jgi:hypothetical protein
MGRAVAVWQVARALHDRFLVLDNKEIWRLGSSINRLGKKAGMFNRVNEATEAVKLQKDLAD